METTQERCDEIAKGGLPHGTPEEIKDCLERQSKFYAESQLKYERELIKKSHKAIKKTTEKVDRIFVVTAYMAIIITIDLVITVIFM